MRAVPERRIMTIDVDGESKNVLVWGLTSEYGEGKRHWYCSLDDLIRAEKEYLLYLKIPCDVCQNLEVCQTFSSFPDCSDGKEIKKEEDEGR